MYRLYQKKKKNKPLKLITKKERNFSLLLELITVIAIRSPMFQQFMD